MADSSAMSTPLLSTFFFFLHFALPLSDVVSAVVRLIPAGLTRLIPAGRGSSPHNRLTPDLPWLIPTLHVSPLDTFPSLFSLSSLLHPLYHSFSSLFCLSSLHSSPNFHISLSLILPVLITFSSSPLHVLPPLFFLTALLFHALSLTLPLLPSSRCSYPPVPRLHTTPLHRHPQRALIVSSSSHLTQSHKSYPSIRVDQFDHLLRSNKRPNFEAKVTPNPPFAFSLFSPFLRPLTTLGSQTTGLWPPNLTLDHTHHAPPLLPSLLSPCSTSHSTTTTPFSPPSVFLPLSQLYQLPSLLPPYAGHWSLPLSLRRPLASSLPSLASSSLPPPPRFAAFRCSHHSLHHSLHLILIHSPPT